MSCTIKVARSHIHYCAIDELRMLRIERCGSNAQKSPYGDWT